MIYRSGNSARHPSRIRLLSAGFTAFLTLLISSTVWADEELKHGEYLTNILGCGGCHTQGALLGEPDGVWLAGSTIGVAYTAESPTHSPGIIFPGNLTPDVATGIGSWSKADVVRFLRTGMDHYGQQANTVMPWPNYALLSERDVNAVAAYILSMDPVSNPIPDSVGPGENIAESFVRIGVYLFIPETSEDG